MSGFCLYATVFRDVWNGEAEATQDLQVLAVAMSCTSTVWVGGLEFDPLRATALAEALTAAVAALNGEGHGVVSLDQLSPPTPAQQEWDALHAGENRAQPAARSPLHLVTGAT